MAERRINGTGGEIVADDAGPRILTADVRDPSNSACDQALPYRSTAHEPVVLRKAIAPKDESAEMLQASQAVARRARDAFNEACEATAPDSAEVSFVAAKQKLGELWNYAHLRDRPFRDLLALLTAATKGIEISQIKAHQRDALALAFADLPKMFLDDELVEEHIDRFADHGVDEVVSPISEVRGKRLKVTIEEID